jgi:predicted dehydrogenase
VLRVGIAGCGRVAGLRHLPALARVEDASVVALADPDATRLAGLGDRFGIDRRHASHEELIADETVDAVAVCVPPALHVPVAVAALEAGKHILVEKPLALDIADAARLVELARDRPQAAAVGFNFRHHRLVAEAHTLMASGALGEVELVRSAFTSSVAHEGDLPVWRERRDLGGGALAEFASHNFDLCRFLLGEELVEVAASTRSDALDDQAAVVTARSASGTLCSFAYSQRTQDENTIEIFGTRACLRLALYRFDGLELSPVSTSPGDIGERAKGLVRTVRALPRGLAARRTGGEFVESYANEWRQFAAASRGEEAPRATLEDGLRALEVLLAANEAARSGRTVSVGGADRVP